jgi:hypothetical protein
MFKEGTGYSEVKQGQEEGRKRTCVDWKHDHQNHQDNPTLVRTQYPSPPDNDAIGDNKLTHNSGRRVSSQGMLVENVRVRGQYSVLFDTDVDQWNVREHH